MSNFQETNQKLLELLEKSDFLGSEKLAKKGIVVVELHNFKIPIISSKAESHKKIITEWCESFPDQNKICGEISYLEMGDLLGDQRRAIKLFALGEVLNLWKCNTPGRVGIPEPMASQMAGMGMITMNGYKKSAG